MIACSLVGTHARANAPVQIIGARAHVGAPGSSWARKKGDPELYGGKGTEQLPAGGYESGVNLGSDSLQRIHEASRASHRRRLREESRRMATEVGGGDRANAAMWKVGFAWFLALLLSVFC